MLPEKLAQRWETAYWNYGNASRAAAVAVPGDRGAARGMASASRNLVAVWREIESTPEMPWWALAALSAAAQAFEFQARDWTARADHAWPEESGGARRPQVRLTARARPKSRHVVPDAAGESNG